MSPFLAWGDFHARSRFAGPTIPEEKWGTTRSLDSEWPVFILEDALSVWTTLGKHLLLVWLFVSSIKTGTRRIIRLDKLFSVVRRSRRITEDNSSRRIMRPLV